MLPNNVEFDQETKLIEDGVSQTGMHIILETI